MASHQHYNKTHIEQNDIMQEMHSMCIEKSFLKELLKTCLIEWPSCYSLRRLYEYISVTQKIFNKGR